jgi:hypothetical protein
MNANAFAWQLACRLFEQRGATLMIALSDSERDAFSLLTGVGLVKQQKIGNQYVLCPYCQLHRGPMVRDGESLYCQCEECGKVSLDAATLGACQIDVDKLIRQLRLALDIPSQQVVTNIADGIWRIGIYRKLPVVLARSVEEILHHPAEMKRAAKNAYAITPKPLQKNGAMLGDHVAWLPMDECFHIYGGQIRLVEPGALADDEVDDSTATHGPFSADFKWVHLDSWQQGPIALSDTQTSVFKVLWNFKGQSQSAERLMNKAGSDSAKPIDVFKIKTGNKGDPKYEGPLHAYKELVIVQRRAGTYSMPCAIGS